MAEKTFKVCGRCERPAKILHPVSITAINSGTVKGDPGLANAKVEFCDLMCVACWKRCKKFIERGVEPVAKAAAETE